MVILHQQDRDGNALLHEVAADVDGEDKLRYLLRQDGCQVDIERADGASPFYRAALAGNVAAVAALLEHPVNVNNHNRDNRWSGITT